MQYIIKQPDGTETDPIDEAVLVQLVEEGRIGPNTDVSNALLKSWKKAKEIRALKEIFDRKKAFGELEDDETPEEKAIRKKEEAEKKKQVGDGGIRERDTFHYVPAGYLLRFAAHLCDLVLVGLILILVNTLILLVMKTESLENLSSRHVLILIDAFIYLMYFTNQIAFKAQTFGQWFLGLITVRATNGAPVFMLRAFLFSVIQMFFWPFTWMMMFVTPKKRGIQDLLTDCRVIRLR